LNSYTSLHLNNGEIQYLSKLFLKTNKMAMSQFVWKPFTFICHVSKLHCHLICSGVLPSTFSCHICSE